MRWQGRARRASGVYVRAAIPEIAWTLTCVAAAFWGWVAPHVLPRDNPCGGDQRTFAVALAVQIALLVAAIVLSVVRGVRLGFSGSAIGILIAAVLLPWASGTVYVWLATGTCWNLTM